MSAKAFVLIEAEVDKSHKVIAALKEIEGITTVERVTGPYDIIAVVEAERLYEIGSLVTGKIKPIPGVSRIVFCLALNEAV